MNMVLDRDEKIAVDAPVVALEPWIDDARMRPSVLAHLIIMDNENTGNQLNPGEDDSDLSFTRVGTDGSEEITPIEQVMQRALGDILPPISVIEISTIRRYIAGVAVSRSNLKFSDIITERPADPNKVDWFISPTKRRLNG